MIVKFYFYQLEDIICFSEWTFCPFDNSMYVMKYLVALEKRYNWKPLIRKILTLFYNVVSSVWNSQSSTCTRIVSFNLILVCPPPIGFISISMSLSHGRVRLIILSYYNLKKCQSLNGCHEMEGKMIKNIRLSL